MTLHGSVRPVKHAMTGMTAAASHAAAHIAVFVFRLTPWMCPLQDLTYKVRNNNNRRQKVTLLYKISGFFVPGELTALVWHSL